MQRRIRAVNLLQPLEPVPDMACLANAGRQRSPPPPHHVTQ